jgi:hypothetical protein
VNTGKLGSDSGLFLIFPCYVQGMVRIFFPGKNGCIQDTVESVVLGFFSINFAYMMTDFKSKR